MTFDESLAANALSALSTVSKQTAENLIGGLSHPSKMPGTAYGIPAVRCITGSKLRPIAGTVCSSCYALKGRYAFANVQSAQERRYATLTRDINLWAAAFVVALRMTRGRRAGYHRWHDSGDIQSIDHANAIAWIAKQLPKWKFWIPTKERAIVSAVSWSKNVTVRLSASRIGDTVKVPGLRSSAVQPKGGKVSGRICPAPSNGGKCGDCRSCWNGRIQTIVYKLH